MNEFKNHCFETNAKRYNSYYMNRFISLKCAPDFLIRGLFPNAKEITESFAMFEATKYLPEVFSWDNPDINIVAVGDGVRPSTAATFAFRSKWRCYSIDPALRSRDYNVDRLNLLPCKIQDINLQFDQPTFVCLPHAHVKMDWVLKAITAPVMAIAGMPCCFPYSCDYEPSLVYRDENVWSPMNLIKIWK